MANVGTNEPVVVSDTPKNCDVAGTLIHEGIFVSPSTSKKFITPNKPLNIFIGMVTISMKHNHDTFKPLTLNP